MAVSKRLRYEVLRRDNHASAVLPSWQPNASRGRANRPMRIEPALPADEIWRPVVGYVGLYEVSQRGVVRSVLRRVTDSRGCVRVFQSKTLRPSHEGNPGYALVDLYHDGKRKTVRVHTLVAEAFIGPRPKGHVVAHWDGDRSHNCLANLRYATEAENQADKLRHGTSNRGARNPRAALSAADVLRIDICLRQRMRQRDIAADFSIARTTVSAIAVGRAWSHFTGRKPEAAI